MTGRSRCHSNLLENCKFLKLLVGETISKDEYKEIAEFNRKRIDELQKEIVKAKQVLEEDGNQTTTLQTLYKYVETALELNSLTPELLHRLVERVEVNQLEVMVHYRFANPLHLAS